MRKSSQRSRLDVELVRRGLARSRAQAAELISEGRVTVSGIVATKSSTNVDQSITIDVLDPHRRTWASRGSYKLLSALESFCPQGLTISGKKCLDAGAAHGGFTDVLLEYGAQSVVAVDVGYGQLPWRLQSDPRVYVHDRTNIRYSKPEDFAGPVEVIVSDLSFISLTVVLPALLQCLTVNGDIIPMVKPQFEVGKQFLTKRGVVDDPQRRRDAVKNVANYAIGLGCTFRGVTASALPGPNGNVEYFLWLQSGSSSDESSDGEESSQRHSGLTLGSQGSQQSQRSQRSLGSERSECRLTDDDIAQIDLAIYEGPQ